MTVHLRSLILLFLASLIISCHGQPRPKTSAQKTIDPVPLALEYPPYGFSHGLADKNGNLWFSSYGSGVYYFDGKKFSHITTSDGLCNNEVTTILEDAKGDLWLGTSNGICKYDGQNFEHLPIPFQDTSSLWLDQVYPVINPNAVHAIIQDQKGAYWIGTGGGGGYHYDGETYTAILRDEGTKYEDSLRHNWIPDIAEDSQGNIWFASMSYGGLNRFDGKTFTNYLKKDGLSDDMVRKILVARDGKIWLGFNGNRESALTVYDGESFTIYSQQRDACHRSVRALYEDKNQNLWIGGEGGICILSEGVFQAFLDEDGQSFSGIIFILEDKNQNIWFGGREGLWQYNGAELIAVSKK